MPIDLQHIRVLSSPRDVDDALFAGDEHAGHVGLADNIGYRYQHLSNAKIRHLGPGTDTNTFHLGVSRLRTKGDQRTAFDLSGADSRAITECGAYQLHVYPMPVVVYHGTVGILLYDSWIQMEL